MPAPAERMPGDIENAEVIAQRAREIPREGRVREDERHDEYDDPDQAEKPDKPLHTAASGQ